MTVTTTTAEATDGADGATSPTAWSLGGRTFSARAPLGRSLPVGALVVLTASARTYLGQVVRSEVATAGKGHEVLVEGTLVARLDGEAVLPAASDDSFDEATVAPADDELLSRVRPALSGGKPTLPLGTLQQPSTEPAALVAPGFSRHTFLCGQSGSGKTYALGVVLEQLLLSTGIRLVVLDPNSDYVGLAELPGVRGLGTAPTGEVTVFRTGGANRLQVRFGRLPAAQQAMVLRLDPLADLEEYALLRRVAQSMGGVEYSVADLRAELERDVPLEPGTTASRLALRIDNLGVAGWGIWAGAEQTPLLDQLPPGWRAAVLDLGGIPSTEERSVVAAATLAGLWHARHDRSPVLVVVDEAHNVCPQTPGDPQQALAIEHTVTIAAEGRKYGLHLLVATQSPRKLHAGVLSQCENLLLMKTSSLADVDHLAQVFSHVPRGLVEKAPGFGMGEGLAAGRISPTPQLFRSGARLSPEGGADVPTTWADPLPEG